MVKDIDSSPCVWGSIPGKSCSFLIVPVNKGLSQYFMCSDHGLVSLDYLVLLSVCIEDNSIFMLKV